MENSYLLIIALILISTKLLGLVSEKVHMPQVVGALLAGILLGPTGLGVLESTEFLESAAQIGVILLMFTAGIDTDLRELKETGVAACCIAVLGVFVPLILCGGTYYFFFMDELNYYNLLKASFVGVVFSATSVSITVETLNEMGKLKSKIGATLLSAALIDDILGIVVLSVICGLSGSDGTSPALVLGRIALFFVFTAVVGFLMGKFFHSLEDHHWHSRRLAVWALAFCLVMAFCAEDIFGVADITGAFMAGIILCNLSKARKFVAKKITVVSYIFFAPIFFASVGMSTNLRDMTGSIFIFALVLTAFAVASKIVGCGLAGRSCGLTSHQSLVVGVGMVARSEVALMVAQKGIDAGMIDAQILPAIILAVIVTSLLTPALLKSVISRGPALV